MVWPAGGLEASEHDREHLLDRAPNLLGHRPRRARTPVVDRDALRHERLGLLRQLGDSSGTAVTGELTEGERDRHAPPDALRAVALLDQPDDIGLDLGRDPRTANPVQ